MEITLEEAIKQLGTYTIPCGKYKAAYDMAIDTMRKYQKIEKIISDYEEYKWEHIDVKDIREILDGNDD